MDHVAATMGELVAVMRALVGNTPPRDDIALLMLYRHPARQEPAVKQENPLC